MNRGLPVLDLARVLTKRSAASGNENDGMDGASGILDSENRGGLGRGGRQKHLVGVGGGGNVEYALMFSQDKMSREVLTGVLLVTGNISGQA